MTKSSADGEHTAAGEVRTFLIADVRGYTQFTVERGDEAAARLTTQFAELAGSVVTARDGRVIEVRGDEVLAVFSSARQALRAAADLQTRLVLDELPFHVGVGLDAGEAVPVPGGYRGAALNLAARLCSLAAAGEVLASEGVIHLARKVEGLAYRERGRVSLKGFIEPVAVLQVVRDDGEAVIPAPPSAAPMNRSGPTAFGKLLHRYRLAAELTQEELAERAHLSARAISDLERGAKTRPHRTTVELLADALDLTPEDRAALLAAIPARIASPATPPLPDLPIGGFLGSLPNGELVARERELEQIERVVDEVLRGAGQLVLLAGEPGVGKTRLAQEVTLALRDRGLLIAAGRCYEPQQAVAFYPFLDALSTTYTAAPPAIRAEAARRWPYLGRLLPDQIGQEPGSTSQGADEQQRLFRAVTDFIVAIAQSLPVAILLDDLHWADSATLDLLQHLARSTRSERVLLLGTYRDVEVGRQHALRRVVRDLNREHLVERISVRRLDRDGTAALVAATLDQGEVSKEFVALVHRQTEGNAFFVHEVVQALVERGDIYRTDGRWERRQIEEIEVPESVRDVIGERLSRLAEQTQEVLHQASVLGPTFGFDDLQAVTAFPEEEVEVALEKAVEAGLVRLVERDDYAFNHALTQQTLYAELSPRRRRRLHRTVGEALEQLPAARRTRKAAELAWHFLQADEPERAVVYALQAGDGAKAVFAHREAERHYRTALELARELGDRAREAEALEKLGAVLGLLTQYDEALALLEQAAEQYRRLDNMAGEMRAAIEIGISERGRGTATQGIERLEPMVSRFEASGPSRELATLYATLERLYIVVGRYADELAAAERASELARQVGDEHALALAEVGRGTALSMLGRTGEGVRVLEDALPLAEQWADSWTLGRALGNLSASYGEQMGDLARAREYSERALAFQERASNVWAIAHALSALGLIHTRLGNWEEARRHLSRGVELAGDVKSSWWAVYPVMQVGPLLVASGEWEEARRTLEEALAAAESNNDLQAQCYSSAPLASLDLAEGQPEAAVARLESLLERFGWDHKDVAQLLPDLAEAYLASGNEPKAEAVLREAIRRTREQVKLHLPDALRVQGMLWTVQGRWNKAKRAFEEAIALARAMPYPYMEARILYELGRMHVRKDEPGLAREWLEQALAICERLRAQPYMERILQTLGELE